MSAPTQSGNGLSQGHKPVGVDPVVHPTTVPSLMNQFISSLKDTAILSAISVNELTMSARTIIARNYKAFEVYSYAAVIYIIVITALTFLSKKVEQRLSYDKR